MSNPWTAQGPVEGFVRPNLGFCSSKSRPTVSYILAICPYFDNLELDIFDAGGPPCYFITFVTISGRIRTLSLY